MNEERGKIIQSLIYPAVFVVLIWLVKLFEITFKIDLTPYGLQPLHISGLLGILTAPFLHEGLSHLVANSIPLFLLGSLLFYFYREIAWKVFLLIFFITGFWVWVFARGDAVHIGASGVVYGLAAFLFLSGILRRESKLMAMSLLTVFLYGGMVWGIFPQLFPLKNISWESHLMGLLSGTILAIYYRKTGPQRKKYDWENEDEEDYENSAVEEIPEEPLSDENKSTSDSTGTTNVVYHYKNGD
jgi:membrane associated rhomboid family serine protease